MAKSIRSPNRQRLAGRLDRLRGVKLFLAVAGPLAIIYVATPTVWDIRSIDPFTNTFTAHSIANEQSVYLDNYEELAEPPWPSMRAWVIWGDERPVSQYPPGAPLHAVGGYLLWPQTHEHTFVPVGEDTEPSLSLQVPSAVPADITAAVVTALAMGFLALTFARLAPGSVALAAAYIAGLGTSAWSVASQQLWQHGPAMLWLAVAGYLLARGRSGGAGVAYAVAIVVRPLTALAAVVPAVFAGLQRRWVSAVGLAAGVAVGAAVIVAYNSVVFGEPSLSGGYGPQRGESLLDTSPVWYGANVLAGLFHRDYGLLTWSPFLAIVLLGVPAAWRHAPSWVRGPAVGGVVYLAGNWLLNRSSGGGNYHFYRYPLEALTAGAPLLLLAYIHWVRPRLWARVLLYVAIAFAVVAHAIAALG